MRRMSSRILLVFIAVSAISAMWDQAIFRAFYQVNADFLSGMLSGEDISREDQLSHYTRLRLIEQIYFGLNTLVCICCVVFLRQNSTKFGILYAIPTWFLGVWFGSVLAGVSPLGAADYQSLAIAALLAVSVVTLFQKLKW